MNEIKNLNDRISDQKSLETYQKYQKFENMLNVYNELKSSLYNQKNISIKTISKLYEKNGFVTDDEKDQVGDFVEYLDSCIAKNPKANVDNLMKNLKDLTTKKNREIIGSLIAKFQKDDNFVIADLDSVAVYKNYGLYKSIADFLKLKEDRALDNENLYKIFNQNKIDPKTFNEIYQKLDKVQKDPNNEIKVKDSTDIVNIVAGVLEISPAEARRDLESLQRVNENYNPEYGGVIVVKDEEENKAALEGNQKVREQYLAKRKEKQKLVDSYIKQYFNKNKDATIENFVIKCKQFCKNNNVIVIPMSHISENQNILKDISENDKKINIESARNIAQRNNEDDEREIG